MVWAITTEQVKNGTGALITRRVARNSTSGETLPVQAFEQSDLLGNFWSYAPAAGGGITNSTAGVTARAAPGAGLRNYITGLQISADALGTATEFVIRDGAGGTVLFNVRIKTSGLDLVSIEFRTPLKCSVNALVEIQTVTASGSGTVCACLQGYAAA